jgi:hypothetical protein
MIPDDVRPVEIPASDGVQLVQWISSRMHQAIEVPDLAASGCRLMSGRLVATSHGPAAMFMSGDDHGSRIQAKAATSPLDWCVIGAFWSAVLIGRVSSTCRSGPDGILAADRQ